MPLYEYKCNDCQFEFEELVSFSNEQINCPKCQSQNVSKKISVFASHVSGGNNKSCERKDCGAGFG